MENSARLRPVLDARLIQVSPLEDVEILPPAPPDTKVPLPKAILLPPPCEDASRQVMPLSSDVWVRPPTATNFPLP